MRQFGLTLLALSLFSMQSVFASAAAPNGKACGAIAHACSKAGFSRNAQDKQFWQDCMNPILMGQTVKKVAIDTNTVDACRTAKIAELTKELQDLQNVESKK